MMNIQLRIGSDLWLTWRIIPLLSDTRPGKRLHNELEKHTIVRSINDFYGVIFQVANYVKVYQAGYLVLTVFVGLIKAMGDDPPRWFQRGIMMKQRMNQWWQPIFGEHQLISYDLPNNNWYIYIYTYDNSTDIYL